MLDQKGKSKHSTETDLENFDNDKEKLKLFL